MANVGSGTSGYPLQGAGNGASPTYKALGTNSGLTAHGVVVAEGNNAFAVTTAGSLGQLLQSKGGSADPAYTTATYPSTSGTTDNVLTSDGTNFVSTPASQFLYFSTSTNVNPSDGSTYAPGGSVAIGSNIDSTNGSRFYMLRDCTVKAIGVHIFVGGTLGSNETATFNIKKNGTTDNTVITGMLYTSASQSYSNLNCGVSLSAGDYVQFIIVNPTWATNPTAVNYLMQVIIQ